MAYPSFLVPELARYGFKENRGLVRDVINSECLELSRKQGSVSDRAAARKHVIKMYLLRESAHKERNDFVLRALIW